VIMFHTITLHGRSRAESGPAEPARWSESRPRYPARLRDRTGDSQADRLRAGRAPDSNLDSEWEAADSERFVPCIRLDDPSPRLDPTWPYQAAVGT
jgi:hypothetical protein